MSIIKRVRVRKSRAKVKASPQALNASGDDLTELRAMAIAHARALLAKGNANASALQQAMRVLQRYELFEPAPKPPARAASPAVAPASPSVAMWLPYVPGPDGGEFVPNPVPCPDSEKSQATLDLEARMHALRVTKGPDDTDAAK